MEALSRLLHELIEVTVPAGNKRGELHVLVDELDGAADAAKGTEAKAPAGAKAAVPAAPLPPAAFPTFTPPAAPGEPAQS